MMDRFIALLRISARIITCVAVVTGRLAACIAGQLFNGAAFLVRRYGPTVARATATALRRAGARARTVTRCQVVVVAIATLTILPACVPVRWEQPAPTETHTGSGVRSERGNPPFYEVFGVRYYVQDSSYGHRERGVASWYGKKFHGNPTSSGEIYDMYALTAAHKTLPLPTRVRVTHLGNGKSVVLKVNDRGPFIDNRIIDLSYAAALKLDMLGTGTALVEVEALTPDGGPTATTASVGPLVAQPPSAQVARSTPRPAAIDAVRLYLQVGAFGEAFNAEQLQTQLRAKGLSNVVIRYDLDGDPALYRVRLGPIADVTEYDALVELVAGMEIRETHLVTETTAPAFDASTTVPSGS
jgi:rare lipoprotein A